MLISLQFLSDAFRATHWRSALNSVEDTRPMSSSSYQIWLDYSLALRLPCHCANIALAVWDGVLAWALSKSSISVIPVGQSTWRCFWLTHRRPLRKLSSLLQFRVCGLQHRLCSQVGRFSNFPYRSSIH